jgi:uncharacterized secreted protein with C-terminal beta-propeller domain
MNNKILVGIIMGIVIVGATVLHFALNSATPEKQILTSDVLYPKETHVIQPESKVNVTSTNVPLSLDTNDDLVKFASYDEIKDFLKDSQMQQQYDYASHGNMLSFRESGPSVFGDVVKMEPAPFNAPELQSGEPQSVYSDFSSTNVQVKNVDEPDYLKNDGKYLYIVNQNWLTIVDAYPGENAKILLKVALDIEQQNLENMFLNGDKLVIFYYGSSQTYGIAQYDFAPYPIYTQKTFATIIDISDREKPKTVTKYEVDGIYVSSRMIGEIVYLVTNSGIDYTNPVLPTIMEDSDMIVPDVYRFPNPESSYTFNTVTAFDVSGKLQNSETFLMGYSNAIYVSEKNLYITYQKNMPYRYYDTLSQDRFFDVVVPLLPQDIQSQILAVQKESTLDPYAKWNKISSLLQDTYNKLEKDEKEKLFTQIQASLEEYDTKMQSDVNRTVIHKIGLDDGNLKYVAHTEVPGYPLNQFSMDESGNRFRIATTSESFSRFGSTQSSNVFVFDENLKQVGSLTKIAPDERIYSARFMDDKLYLVTFKQVDPFFVIDLSADSPKILGALKIPGFSNYLQPYDKDHIIGIGRDTKENEWGGIQTMGIKISMFDVSDFDSPKEVDTILIGDSSVDSEALYDHRALLLNKQKNVMSIPIKGNIPSIFDDSKMSSQHSYWSGFFVYGFDDARFVEKGHVSHFIVDNYNAVYMPARSLYIENNLYTIMDGNIKINDLDNISNEIKNINIGSTGKIIRYLDK